jgi:energy-coupling factor transport system permease protein
VTALRIEPEERELQSPLGRLGPLVKLLIAVGWLLGLTLTTRTGPPLAIAAITVAAGVWLGRIPLRRLAVAAAPLWIAALSVGFFNAVFAAPNVDPTATEIARIGPLRLTETALVGAAGVAARIVAIAVIGVVIARTTDSTALVDALVQRARVPDRFAYGALAAYQALPRLAEDLTTLRQARRIRGLRGSWHPRILVGLLVLAVRHGDRLALAMDSRGFGSGPRTRYRTVHATALDPLALLAAISILIVVLALL